MLHVWFSAARLFSPHHTAYLFWIFCWTSRTKPQTKHYEAVRNLRESRRLLSAILDSLLLRRMPHTIARAKCPRFLAMILRILCCAKGALQGMDKLSEGDHVLALVGIIMFFFSKRLGDLFRRRFSRRISGFG